MSAPATPAGVSIREFARRDGCDDKLVRRALQTGHLCALPDGKLDPVLVGSGWRKENRRGADKGADKGADTAADKPRGVRTRRPQESEPPVAPAPIAEMEAQPHGGALKRSRRPKPEPPPGHGNLTLVEAERLKEQSLARLRQLEYDARSGQVVRVEDVAGQVGALFATVRTRLLAMPAEQAPRLHRCKGPAEIQAVLAELISEVLQELAADGALRPRA